MKKEFGFIDSDGNISNDENRFIQEYADFLKNNPEKLERLNELKQRNKKYEDLQYKPFEGLEFVMRHGEFKQAVEFWFRSVIKEIESKKDDKGYFNFLSQEKTTLKMLVPILKKYINLYSEVKENFEFWIFSIELLLSIIKAELKRFKERETKSKTLPKKKVLAFNDEVIESLDSFKIIQLSINKLLFENSEMQMWEQLLKGNVLENPIIIGEKVTIKDFKYFIRLLQKKILKGNIYTDFERLNAFLYKGEILKAKQIQKANDNTESKLKNKIDEIISMLD